jgi:hypothetical protein
MLIAGAQVDRRCASEGPTGKILKREVTVDGLKRYFAQSAASDAMGLAVKRAWAGIAERSMH